MIGTSTAAALARWFRGPRALLGGFALAAVAAVGAVLFIGAYWNPPGNADRLSAAIVNEDVPTTANGRTIAAGADVTTRIVNSDTLRWSETTMAQAQEGLDGGRYALVLRIPENFSASVASLDSGTPAQAQIVAYTNDATNYLSGDLAENAIADLETEISSGLSLNFINEVYNALPQARAQGESAVAQSQVLAEGINGAAAQSNDLANSTKAVSEGVSQAASNTANAANSAKGLVTTADSVTKSSTDVQTSVNTLNSGAKSVDSNLVTLEADLKARNLADLAAKVTAIRTTLATSVTKPANDLVTQSTALATATKQLSSDATAVSTTTTQTSEQLANLATSASGNADAAAALSGTMNNSLVPQSAELSEGLADAASKVPPVSDEQRQAFTTVLAKPIDITQERQNEVRFMGEGFAALFVPSALFLGAMVIFLLNRPLNRRQLDLGLPAWHAMLTRWIPGFVWVVAQVVLVTVGLLILGVQAAAWPGLIGLMLLTGVAFLSLVQLFKAMLGGGGHLVVLALLLLQIVASGAIFPIQTLGGFFALLHPVMPMTYAVDAVRRTIAGGPLTPYLWIDVLVLVAVALSSACLTFYVASRKRRLSQADLQPAITLG